MGESLTSVRAQRAENRDNSSQDGAGDYLDGFKPHVAVAGGGQASNVDRDDVDRVAARRRGVAGRGRHRLGVFDVRAVTCLYLNGTAVVLEGVTSSQASTVMVDVPVAPTPR